MVFGKDIRHLAIEDVEKQLQARTQRQQGGSGS
jgi:hypothetical protein